MKALLKLHLKENIRGKSFILFGILGGIVTLILLSGGKISSSNNPTEAIISQFGTQWKILSIIAGFAAVTVSMGTIEQHRKEKRTELLALHGLSLDRQLFGLALGNSLVSMVLAFILAIVLIIMIVIGDSPTNFWGLIGALAIYLISTGLVSLLVSMMNLFVSSIFVAVLGVILVVIGSFHQLFQGLLLNQGNIGGELIGKAMSIIPPLDVFNRLARTLFFLEYNSHQDLLIFLLFIWLILTVLYFVSKGVARRGQV